MNKSETLGKILASGFVPIVVEDNLPVLDCLEQVVAMGLEAVEISCRHPQALALIGQARRSFPGLAVGAATLVEDGRLREFLCRSGRAVPSVAEAVDAGADFLVSMLPFREETYTGFADSHVIVAGVSSVGECHRALDWGANLLKFVNPHLLGGPDYFRAMDPASYHSFPFFLTGGMRAEVFPPYVEAGVLAFGGGFDLILGADYRPLQVAFDADLLREKLEPYGRILRRARQQYQAAVPFDSKDPVAISAATGRCLNVP